MQSSLYKARVRDRDSPVKTSVFDTSAWGPGQNSDMISNKQATLDLLLLHPISCKKVENIQQKYQAKVKYPISDNME